MISNFLPGLNFPNLTYGTSETHHDLNFLLYRGASGQRRDLREAFIESQSEQSIDLNRLPLVRSIHAAISYFIALGRSRETIENYLIKTYVFFRWCDKNDRLGTADSIVTDYKLWSDYLWHETNIVKIRKPITAYGFLCAVDTVISEALGVPMGILRLTRFAGLDLNSGHLGSKSDELDIDKSFEFGHFLLDITRSLTADNIYSTLPIEISLRTGLSLYEWCRLNPPEDVKALQVGARPADRVRVLAARAAREADRSHRTRFPVINLRVEAELLIFISQTGMNLAQAHKLKRSEYRFKSSKGRTAVYEVFKGRRQGAAAFWIYSEYEEVFSDYLKWLDDIFGADEPKLFPFIYPDHVPRKDHPPSFQAVVKRAQRAGLEYIGPRALRTVRSNWLLRRSDNPDLTAEMSQHTKAVMLKNYIRPQFSVAAAQITRFHNATDPSVNPPGPGVCVGLGVSPVSMEDKSPSAPAPDCANPAGCMFCSHQRDVYSQDYVWLLTTYRECKSLELDRFLPNKINANDHPASHVIAKIDAKLAAFQSIDECKIWVEETNARIKEGRFHPMFDGLIKLMELGS